MTDFSRDLFCPSLTMLSTFGLTSMAGDSPIATGVNAATNAWTSNNLGIFVPVWTELQVTVFQMAIIVTTQSGNVDVGIYDINGNRLVRAGSTAVGAAGIQVFDIADTTLSPGTYFLGMACSTTAAFFRNVSGSAVVHRSAGVQQMANAFSSGLVDPVTYTGLTNNSLPLIAAPCVATI